MASTNERKCPDCGAKMHSIRMIDKAHGGGHTDLEYTLPESRRSFWTGTYPVEGKALAFMCDQCARIALFGAAREQAS
jgi:hypothetical protein